MENTTTYKQEKEHFVPLPETFSKSGVDFTKIKQDGIIYMYQRSDKYYEVFRVKRVKACVIYGKSYPNREVYPGDNDFGVIAYCCWRIEDAEKRFNELLLRGDKD